MFDEELDGPAVLVNTKDAIAPFAVVQDGGVVDVSKEPQHGPFIVTKYHPDDGYEAARMWTAEFEPDFKQMHYVILTRNGVGELAAGNFALVRRIDFTAHFGRVAWVNEREVVLQPPNPGGEVTAIRRDEVEMVYLPVDQVFTNPYC